MHSLELVTGVSVGVVAKTRDHANPDSAAAEMSDVSMTAVHLKGRGATYCFADCGGQGQKCASWGWGQAGPCWGSQSSCA